MFKVPAWKKAPFIRILPFFISGILLEYFLRFEGHFLLITVSILLLLFAVHFFIPFEKKYKYRKANGFITCVLLAAAGAVVTWDARPENDPAWFGHFISDSSFVYVSIEEPPSEKNKSFKTLAKVHAVRCNKITATNGNLLVYFSKDQPVPVYGDRFLLTKTPVKITGSGNPGSFDYGKYMAFRGIHHQVYIDSSQLIHLGNERSFWKVCIYRARDYALKTIQRFIPDKVSAGLAEALLVGYKDDLDKELIQEYSNAGVVHIIAISGLHLGLIYMVITIIVSYIPVLNRKKVLQYFLILACLWYFTMITGCPASAFRSAVMFSLILTGKTFFRQQSIYNAICSSAVVLLCIDPFLLWDVGFQLSYIAVAGIVWLQSPVYKLFYFKNRFARKVWGLISVTLAAQAATTPLCIYYFHQFPNLFLLTNLVSVPLSSIILFAGMFLFSISWIPVFAEVTGKLIAVMIRFMNAFIRLMNEISFSVSGPFNTGIMFTFLFYLLILSLCICFLYKKRSYFLLALLCLLLLTTETVYKKAGILSQYKFIVYNIRGSSAWDFISQDRSVLICDSLVKDSASLKSMNITPARIKLNIDSSKESGSETVSLFRNKTFVFLTPGIHFRENMAADIVVVSKNVFNAEQAAALNPSIIVFDSSNSLWKIEKWISDCERLNLPFYSVPHSGAFVLDL